MYVGLVSGNVLPGLALGALVHTKYVCFAVIYAYDGVVGYFPSHFKPQKYLVAP
jgi:hypothetical protein